MIENVYLDLFRECDGDERFSLKRDNLVSKYSWAVPNDEAIEILCKYSPLVEIGAGTGYWAFLAQCRGANVIPYDAFIGDNNKYKHHETYTKVHKGNPTVLKEFGKGVNLFLCWPPYDDSMAEMCLKYFKGEYIIYVGEGMYGCTGNYEFHEILEKAWDYVESVAIPRWFGLRDYLDVYKRKPSGKRKLNLKD